MKSWTLGLIAVLTLVSPAKAQSMNATVSGAASKAWSACLQNAAGSSFFEEIYEVGNSKTAARKLFSYAMRSCQNEGQAYQEIVGKSEFRKEVRYQRSVLIPEWELEIESRKAEAI